jgi:hypothetical protein
MKSLHRFTLGLLLSASLAIGSARATDLGSSPDSGFGAGVMIGEPTGISLKYWLSENSAVDGVVGWSFDHDPDFHVHADYLYHLFDLIPVEVNRLPLYFGGGVRYKLRDGKDDLFGFRGVVGVSYLFDDLPIDIFVEAGPILDVAPEVKARYTIGIGARFWF